MIIALLSGIALMYFVLVIQFNSFSAPLAVMLSLPVSLFGVVVALIPHARHAQPDEPDRRDHADGSGGEERHLASRRHASEGTAGIDREEALMHAGRKRLGPS